jgi:hypothetical protein
MNNTELDQEIKRLLESDLSDMSYSDLSTQLKDKGYDQTQRRYIMDALEEKVLIPQAEAHIKPNFKLKIVVGSVLCLLSLVTVGSLYLGQSATREVYYVAIAVFAVGYYILRGGLKEKRSA